MEILILNKVNKFELELNQLTKSVNQVTKDVNQITKDVQLIDDTIKGTLNETLTSATIAQQQLETIIKEKRDYQFIPTNDSSVLSLDLYNQLKQCLNECDAVKLTTPIFKSLCLPLFEFSNTEFSNWLETEGAPMKPFGVFTPIYAYTHQLLSLPAYTTSGQGEHNDWRFGGVYDSRLYNIIYLINWNLNMSLNGFGELIIQLQHINITT